MYYFEGDFRTRQQQSFSGANKKEPVKQLVNRQAEERKKREEHRKQIQCAIKIQSFYRGFRCREKLKSSERLLFDTKFHKLQQSREVKVTEFFYLVKRLGFFYRHSADYDRLVNLCQWCLARSGPVVQYVSAAEDNSLYAFKKLVALCSWCIEKCCDTGTTITVPFRMVEVFTSASLYTSFNCTDLSSKLMHYIISKGFYKSIRRICNEKLPPSITYGTLPHVAVADAMMELAIKPFSASSVYIRKESLHALSQEFLSQHFSPQVEHYFLPALVDKFSSSLYKELLALLISSPVSPNQAQWLLISLLCLAEKHLDGQFADLHVQVVSDLISSVIRHDSNFQHQCNLVEMHDSDSDEMETEEDSLLYQCVQYINKARHADIIVSLAETMPNSLITVAICKLCYFVLLISKSSVDIGSSRLINRLTLNSKFLRHLWQECISASARDATGSSVSLLRALMFGTRITEKDIDLIIPMIYLFCHFMNTLLLTLHDDEFFTYDVSSSMPFRVVELAPMVTELRDLCLGLIDLAYPESTQNLSEGYQRALRSVRGRSHTTAQSSDYVFTWTHLFLSASSLLRQLYARNIRRPFCHSDQWLCSHLNLSTDKVDLIYKVYATYFLKKPFGNLSVLNPDRFSDDESPVALSVTDIRTMTILKELPFVVPFAERVKLFQQLLTKDKFENQGESWLGRPIIDISVRRDYIYEDSFEKLSPENEPNMKRRMQVKMKNAVGLDEAGIDGGGITREFLNELLKTAFDPNRGFFKYTSDKLLYPNPQALLLEPDPTRFAQHYFFLGRILGKAIYEKMLVELPFAAFFLSKILGRHGNVDIHHLVSLDPELYRNLLVLKQMPDVSDMGLDFTIVNNDLGQTEMEELKPGGKDIIVTNSNKIEYIHLMSNYRLNRQIMKHCTAFRKGLSDVVDLGWLALFDHNELQVLVSGAHVPVDVSDLRMHTVYTGPYTADHATIQLFWRVFDSFTDTQRRQLLRFVTSCSRPPLLGFKDLHPPFCIQPGGSEDRLPTSSTCMNLLKLPPYSDFDTMKQKLLYSIEAGAGFELS